MHPNCQYPSPPFNALSRLHQYLPSALTPLQRYHHDFWMACLEGPGVLQHTYYTYCLLTSGEGAEDSPALGAVARLVGLENIHRWFVDYRNQSVPEKYDEVVVAFYQHLARTSRDLLNVTTTSLVTTDTGVPMAVRFSDVPGLTHQLATLFWFRILGEDL